MFSKTIVDSDRFLDLPPAARLLYYELGIRCDDDGFCACPGKILRMTGAERSDLRTLTEAGLVLELGGVVVLRDWRIHNSLRADRLQPLTYPELARELWITETGSYATEPTENCMNLVEYRKRFGENRCDPLGELRKKSSENTGFGCDSQDRIGEDRVKEEKKNESNRNEAEEEEKAALGEAPEGPGFSGGCREREIQSCFSLSPKGEAFLSGRDLDPDSVGDCAEIFRGEVGSHGPVGGGGDDLPQGLCPQVAGGKDAGQVRLRGLSGQNIAGIVEGELVPEQVRGRAAADADENAVAGEDRVQAAFEVAKAKAIQMLAAEQACHGGIPAKFEIHPAEQRSGHGLLGPQDVPPVDEDDAFAEAREQQGVGSRGVAAPNHGHDLVPVGHTVAGGAVVDAPAQKGFLPGKAQGLWNGARGENGGPAVQDAPVRLKGPDRGIQDGTADFAPLHGRAEPGGGFPHGFAEGEAVDPVREAGVIVDPGGQGHLAAGGKLFQQQGIEAGPGAVEGGGAAGRSAAEDDDVIEMGHGNRSFRLVPSPVCPKRGGYCAAEAEKSLPGGEAGGKAEHEAWSVANGD